MNLTKVDFYPYLYKLCEEFKVISKMEEVDFKYNLKDEKFYLKCEPTHLENAINNILDNAKKYSLEPPKKITLTAQVIHNKLEITIKDQGVGINKKDQGKIFKKHFRVAQGDLHNVKGYGLGLSYVKKIIKLHKGKIYLVSKINEGTIITIKLPIVN
ncbi:MAG: sensor histidine kinase [Lutibacter sp.]